MNNQETGIYQMNTHTLPNPYINSDTDAETRNRWLFWLIAVQLGILYAPTCLWLWDRWTMSVWQNGHGILVTALVLYLVWGELQKLKSLPVSSNPWGFAILIPALLIHMLDTGIHSQLLSGIALFLSLPGLALLFLGSERTKAILSSANLQSTCVGIAHFRTSQLPASLRAFEPALSSGNCS